VIRLTTITLRHFDAGERAPSTTPITDICSAANCSLFDHLVGACEQRRRDFLPISLIPSISNRTAALLLALSVMTSAIAALALHHLNLIAIGILHKEEPDREPTVAV
jgi:hypothetical protein